MKRCPDCCVQAGHLHDSMCDVERCPECGGQYISCGCTSTEGRMAWTGEWPGISECKEYGLYCRMIPMVRGWQRCKPDHPDARPDLNRLIMEGVWDKDRQRFVLPKSNQKSD